MGRRDGDRVTSSLGVVFESEWTDLEALGEPFNPPETVPFCIDRVEDEESVVRARVG